MIAIAKSPSPIDHMPRWQLPRLFDLASRRRRRATIDLIHASPHLLRDIGATEGNLSRRGR